MNQPRSIDSTLGITPPSPDDVASRMVGLHEQLDSEFQAKNANLEALRAQRDPLRQALFPSPHENTALQAATRASREALLAGSGRALELPGQRPVQERIFTGSLGATRVPPYWWASSWKSVAGQPQQASATGTDAGNLALNAWTDEVNASSISLHAWVGTYFRPPTEVGILDIWSTPSMTCQYGDFCTTDGASTFGWLGLFVQEYDSEGIASGAPVVQQNYLWSDASWWSGIGWQFGSNSGIPLVATLEVDHNHSYGLFVWCGVAVNGAGFGDPSAWNTWGSGATAELNIHVPSITWELF